MLHDTTAKFKTELLPCDEKAIAKAAALLKNGQVVGMPTETVYGLAADATNESAVQEIFRVKGRPQDNPLIVHIADPAMLPEVARDVPERAYCLMNAFWPGPLTIILQRASSIPSRVSAGMETVAVRFPSHPVAQALIKASGKPLAAPSANRSGIPSPTTATHVYEDLKGRIPLILDGGSCSVGVESTVITLCTKNPRILRPGYITREQLSAVLGCPVEVDEACLKPAQKDAPVASPGMKYKHYAPRTDLTLVEGSLEDFVLLAKKNQVKAVLCFEEDAKYLAESGFSCICFGKRADGASQAKELFCALRRLDDLGCDKAYARMPQKDGVGLAVLNRIIRAAAFRVLDAKTGLLLSTQGNELTPQNNEC